MPEPRLSVLIVAKNEAHNLAECLAATSAAAQSIKVPEARVTALGVIAVEQSRSARFRARGKAQCFPSG